MSDKTQFHIQRLGSLRTDRGNFNSQWEEAASLILTGDRNSFQSYGMTTGLTTQGEKKTDKQFDSTASIAASRHASILESLSTPQNSVWHLLKAGDKVLQRNRQVRQYFDDLNDALFNWRYRPSANFVGNIQQVYLSAGVYGNGLMFIDQPEKERGLRYRNVHLSEAYFVQNHANVVDTVYRCFWLTARQLKQQFSKQGDSLPDEVEQWMSEPNGTERKAEILHVVTPREDYDPTRMGSKGMKFESCYIYVSKQQVIRESGFRTFPYAVTRYMQSPGETYGRGPAQMVLPAIKVLNEEKQTMLKQGHRAVDPVLLAHDDGNLSSFSMKAGALNAGGVSAEGRALIQALPVGNIAIGDKLMDLERQPINDAFLVPLFQILVDSPQMTATEVLERAREKGMLLAPTAGRLQAEFLGPLIERELDILAAQDLLPPMPPILQQAQAEYKIVYDSPMSRMQRAEGAAGYMRALTVAAEYAKMTGDVESLDYFDMDKAMPEIQEINGSPVRWTRSEEEVQARRAKREQAAAAQQMVDAAPAAASVMKTAATLPQQAA